jgi:hypothetical protein
VFLAVRTVGLAILWLMSWIAGADPVEELNSYDGHWLVDIAEFGYSGLDPEKHSDAFGYYNRETPYAFFPGCPMTISTLRLLGLGKVTAGLVVSLIAGVATAYALVRIAKLVPGGSRRAGLIFVALFASAPMAVAPGSRNRGSPARRLATEGTAVSRGSASTRSGRRRRRRSPSGRSAARWPPLGGRW